MTAHGSLHSLRSWIRVYDDALPSDLCAEARDVVDRLGARSSGGYRNCTEATIPSAPGTQALFERVRISIHACFERYKADIGADNLSFISHIELPAIVRYDQRADRFERHSDVWNPESALRQLTYTAYLNDVELGGATAFPVLGMNVEPKRGRVLMFPPFYLFQHAGTTPISAPKYTIVGWLCFPPLEGAHYTTVPLAE
jgi:hypothetical protein